ncbi:hypothetical protein CISIN_1g0447651mg, partial [Citrus sinensis]
KTFGYLVLSTGAHTIGFAQCIAFKHRFFNYKPDPPPDSSALPNLQATCLLESDQALMADPRTAALVKAYSTNPYLFSYDFAESMAKMSKIGYSPGKMGRSGSPV